MHGSDILAILYADDMANVSDNVRSLQAQLDVIAGFCNRTGMKINMSKTKIIVLFFVMGVTLEKMKNGTLMDIGLKLYQSINTWEYLLHPR